MTFLQVKTLVRRPEIAQKASFFFWAENPTEPNFAEPNLKNIFNFVGFWFMFLYPCKKDIYSSVKRELKIQGKQNRFHLHPRKLTTGTPKSWRCMVETIFLFNFGDF